MVTHAIRCHQDGTTQRKTGLKTGKMGRIRGGEENKNRSPNCASKLRFSDVVTPTGFECGRIPFKINEIRQNRGLGSLLNPVRPE